MRTTFIYRALLLAGILSATDSFGQTNTNCASAIALVPGVARNVDTTGVVSTGNPVPSCNSSLGHGVWYTVTPAVDERVNISTCGSGFGTVMAVYTGTCGALTNFTCADRSNPFGCGSGSGQAGVSFSGVGGTTYYVLVGGNGGTGGSLFILATLVPPPANDTCANAIPLASGVTYTTNTFNATEFGDGAPSCNGNFGRGVWYTVTPTINERVNITTCGSDFGTVMAVYTGTCGALTNFTCADRSNPFGCGSFPGQAGVSFSGVGGTTYYVLVGGNGGTGGNLSIVATLVPPPANDTCANATPLVSGVTNLLYTFNATEFGDTLPSCNGSFGRGVWYTVTPAINERVNINTCGSDFGTIMAVYTGTCGALTNFTCADRSNPFGCGSFPGQAGVSFSGVGGTTYYVLVGGNGGTGGNLSIVATLVPPPVNDTCANGIVLVSGVTYTTNTFNATEFGDASPSCNGNFGRGVWYTVTPAINERVNINTCGSDFGTIMAVYTGTCGALTNFTCADRGNPFGCGSFPGQAGVSFSGVGGTTYYVLVGGNGGTGGNLSIVATLVPPPVNDTCANAIALASGVTYTTNTFNATEFDDASPSCNGNFGRGVWYTVTPAINERVNISTCGSDFGTIMAVYTGTCGALTNFTCADRGNPFGCGSFPGQAGVSFSGVGGTTYYVLVGGNGGTGGNLSIVATLVPPPINDTCANAIALASGVTYTTNTFNATEFGDASPSCNGNFGRGVWYTVTPAINERVNISTCGSDFGTIMAVYTGTCGALTNFTCADRGNPFGCGSFPGQAGVSFSGVGGTTYYVLVGGNGGTGGNLSIVATLVPPPVNDTCANAIALASGVTYTTNTFNATEFGDASPSCNGNFGRGVWYTVTPTINERVNINTCGSDFGTIMAVYTGTCGALTNFTCADRSNPFGCGSFPGQAGVSFSGVGGTTYYVLVGGNGGTGGNLSIVATLVPPPVNDTCANGIALVSGVTYTTNTFNATEFGDASPSCNGNFGRGVWYTVTPAINERVNINTCGSDFGTIMAVYTGTCGALTNFTCADRGNPFGCGSFPGQAGVSFSGVGGTTYYVLVGGNGGTGGNLSIVATLVPPPVNDTCANAIALASGVTYTTNTFNATEFDDASPSCNGNFGRGVWYTVTSTTNGQITINTCGSDFGTIMAVYTGTCGALTNFTCADRGNPFGCGSFPGQSGVSFSGVGGTTYYVLVGGNGGTGGNLSIVANVPAPPNDTCGGAIAMNLGTSYRVNTLSATGNGDPVPNCQSSFGRGVWYTITPPVNERIGINTCGSDFGTVMAVYTGTCGTLTPLLCADRNGLTCPNEAELSFNAAGGTNYYIFVGGIGGVGGNLQISANVVLPPTITGISPNHGPTNGGTVVTLTGANFAIGATVSFGSSAAISNTVAGGTNIFAVTPTSSAVGPVDVVVTNPNSDSATLTNGFAFTAPPFILAQTPNQSVIVGSNAQFQVQLSGQPPFTYQWYFNGTNLSDNAHISGSQTNALTVAPAQTNDAGGYQLIVNNLYGSATSAVATLTVLVPPSILAQPLDRTNFGGSTASFTVTAAGTAPLNYQWRKNGAVIPGATGTNFALANVQLTNAGGYSVVITNIAGAVTSRVAVLTISAPSLQVSSITVPSVVFTGTPFNVSWVETNAGTATAVSPWVDNIYLSPTAQFQFVGSQFLGSFQSSGSLPAGQAIARNQTVNVNASALTNGQYYIAVLADANATVPGESGANTPLGISSNLTLNVIPPPDLVANALQPLGPLNSGQTFSYFYTVLNQGGGPASGNWIDRVYLSTNTTIAGAVATWAAQEYQTLSAGGSYTRTNHVALPSLHSGTYYLIAASDANNNVFENNNANNNLTISVNVAGSASVLVASPASLQTTMLRGGQSVISFSVANVGAQESGDLQVILPSGAPWLSLVSTQIVASLLPGQSNLVTLALTPASNLPLGPYFNTILLYNSDLSLEVPCEFDCVSTLKGAVRMTVQDEFSIYAAGTPNVSNAAVCLTQLLTGTNQACAVTGASGLLTFTNLQEGYYNVAVRADQHTGFSAVYYVAGNQTLDLTAFLARKDLVSYAWLVTTSSIPDHYTFQLITTFESTLPPSWPVIAVNSSANGGAINLCDYLGASNTIVNLNITNGGLLTAQGLKLAFGSHPAWRIQPLVTNLGDLAGISSTNVPVLITQIGSAPATNQFVEAHLFWYVSAPNRDNLNYDSMPRGFVYNANPAGCASDDSAYGPLLAAVAPNSLFNTIAPGVGGNASSGSSVGPVASTPNCLSCGQVGSSTQNPIFPGHVVLVVIDGGKIRAKISLSQNLTTTRNAFTAALELENNSGSTLTNVTVTLNLLDATNGPATALFGLVPAGNVLSDPALNNSNSQTFAWSVLPSTNAAPATTTQYAAGGSLGYILDGLQVTIPLPPLPFFVLPDSRLQADYFLERDVYGDDPISLNTVEPSVPFALGLLMRNAGNGASKDVSLTSAQPLIESTNGLVIPFKLVSSQVGPQPVNPRWDNVGLADIAPHARAEVLWWMTSPLLGRFVDYAAAFQQVDFFGQTNLSLMDSIALHPITHVVRATVPADDGLPDFLALDPDDLYGLPTTLYNSDGSITNVTSLTDPTVSSAPSPLQTNVTLSLVTPGSGWVYLRINDPAANGMALASVKRADGKSLIMSSNVWTTASFRTNVVKFGGASPIQPPYLHLFDYNPTTNYILSYRLAGPAICPEIPRSVVDGQTLLVTNCISGASPNPPFFWGLDSSAPAGAQLNRTNGIFAWTPACDQGSRIYAINIWATNSANPPATSVAILLVAVSDCLQVGVGSTIVQVGHTSCVPVTVLSSVGLTNLNFIVSTAPDRFTNWTIIGVNSAIGQTGTSPLDSANTRVSLSALPGQNFLGPAQICSICASALPGPSAFLRLSPTGILATNSSGLAVGNPSGQSGRIIVIGREPLLEATLAADSKRLLTLYGNPNSSYAIGYRTNLVGSQAFLAAGTNWPLVWRVPMTNLWQTFAANPLPPQLFYRAWEFFADPPILDLRPADPINLPLLVYGRASTNYVLQGTTNLANPGSWQPVTTFTLTNSFKWLNLGRPTNKIYFYRLKR